MTDEEGCSDEPPLPTVKSSKGRTKGRAKAKTKPKPKPKAKPKANTKGKAKAKAKAKAIAKDQPNPADELSDTESAHDQSGAIPSPFTRSESEPSAEPDSRRERSATPQPRHEHPACQSPQSAHPAAPYHPGSLANSTTYAPPHSQSYPYPYPYPAEQPSYYNQQPSFQYYMPPTFVPPYTGPGGSTYPYSYPRGPYASSSLYHHAPPPSHGSYPSASYPPPLYGYYHHSHPSSPPYQPSGQQGHYSAVASRPDDPPPQGQASTSSARFSLPESESAGTSTRPAEPTSYTFVEPETDVPEQEPEGFSAFSSRTGQERRRVTHHSGKRKRNFFALDDSADADSASKRPERAYPTPLGTPDADSALEDFESELESESESSGSETTKVGKSQTWMEC